MSDSAAVARRYVHVCGEWLEPSCPARASREPSHLARSGVFRGGKKGNGFSLLALARHRRGAELFVFPLFLLFLSLLSQVAERAHVSHGAWVCTSFPAQIHRKIKLMLSHPNRRRTPSPPRNSSPRRTPSLSFFFLGWERDLAFPGSLSN